jgi:OmpA-OmpF porin, OOP family
MTQAISVFFKLLIVNVLLNFSATLLRSQNPAASSRNLVINPSFETRALTTRRYQTQTIIDTIAEFLGWTSPSMIPAEMYGTTKEGFIADETNLRGQRDFKAMTGTQVACLEVCCTQTALNLRDILKRSYLEGELKTPLEVGQKYYAGFGLHFHCISVNGIGMAFEFKENIKDTSSRLHLRPVMYQKQLWDYDKNRIWMMVVDSFIADKPYKNFYIGNFFGNDSTATSGSKSFGHYLAFIDDVFVIKGTDTKMPPPKPKPVPPPPPLPKILNLVQFEYNSAQILPNSSAQLDSAVLTLQRFPKLKVLIKGHTSGEGNAERNQQLSENRAKAVRDYLVGKGIAAERLQAKGFSATQPLVVENSEEDRKQNRRIEFEVLDE